MKKKLILLPLLGILIYAITTGMSSGPGGDLTTSGGCSCHGSSSASTTLGFELLNGGTPVTTWVAGQSYTIRLTGTQTDGLSSLPKFGFQLKASAASSGTTTAGTMTAPGSTVVFNPGGADVCQHTERLDPFSGTGGAGTLYRVNINWVAPATGFGDVRLNAALNAVNNMFGADGGDKWNFGTSINFKELGQITGTATTCVTGTTTLSNIFSGGVWTVSAGGIASVATASGTTATVTGLVAGTATITYTAGGNFVTRVVTVTAGPGTFGGTPVVCMTNTTTVTNSTPGGTWSCPTTSIATIVPATGVVTGVGAGTALVTYTVGSCSATATVTVNPLAANTGTTTACTGSTTTLTNANAGGTWSSSNLPVATVNLSGSTGTIAGLVAGTSNIVYSLPTGCNATTTITVNQTPAAIGGTLAVCSSGTVTATNSITGGTWSASAGSGIVTVGATSGIVSGISASGTANLTYTLPGGCFRTAIVTINPLPAAITGTGSLCANATTTLNSTTTGGTWASSITSVATVGATTGIVAGIGTAGGNSTLTYTLPTGCQRTTTVTVNPISPVTGILTVCTGSNTTLSSAPASGTWTSVNTSVATIGSTSGIVLGVSGGTTIVSYTSGAGCKSSDILTVNPVSPITGGGGVCTGATLSLANTIPGGTWSSGSTSVGTINSTSGLFSALSTGTSTINYTTPAGCISTTVVTVNAAPGAVTGSGSGVFCGSTTIGATGGSGGTIYFQNTTPGGTSTATPSISHVVTSTGTYYFRVQSSGGCWGPEAAISVTINPAPAAITGTAAICVNATTTLNSTTTGGTWQSSDPSKATIGSTTGEVLGIAAGTSNITYTAIGCTTTRVVTVNPLPGAVTASGSGSFCGSTVINATGGSGGTIFYQGTTSNGVSTSTASSSQTITSTGTYFFRSQTALGCWGNQGSVAVTVNPNPAAIAGAGAICAGSTTLLTNTTSGGTWVSSNTAVATINAAGNLTGITIGTSTISYTVTATGCLATKIITVNPLPGSIIGTLAICEGGTTALIGLPTGGTWQSSNTATATIGLTSGVATGLAIGTTTITYMVSTGCFRTATLTVNPLPAGIAGGSTSVCVGSQVTFTNSTPGGTWSGSSNVAVGSATGTVTGVTTGTATITYSLPTGCQSTTSITVNPLPAAIGGTLSVCAGGTTTLFNSTTGGTWTSSTTANATVGSSTGIVGGVLAGTSNISYILTTGCLRSVTVTVNPLPEAIAGTASTCVGITTTLTSTTSGGTWTSSATGVATVGSASGVVTGTGTGTATISYRLATNCGVSAIVTVNPAPTAGTVSGSTSVCTGLTIGLSSTVSGGTWSSSAAAVASVNASSGMVTGITFGTAVMTYAVSGLCGTVTATHTVTVTNSAVSGTISGPTGVCIGNTVTLTSSVLGGTWQSASGNVSVGLTSGAVTGLSTGTASITYTISSSCGIATTTNVITVNPLPSAITGSATLCENSSTILANTGAGTWSSGNTAVATVGSATGIVSGLSAGTAVITFTQNTGCITTRTVTVTALPAAIGGTQLLCAGNTTTLTNSSGAGTWASSNLGMAIIGSSSGFVNTITAGNPVISFTLTSTGCIRTAILTINPIPANITGTTNVCVGGAATLTNVTPGGTWLSNNTSVAAVGSTTGLYTGGTAGVAVISYILPTGCRKFTNVTVNALPTAISGDAAVCVSATTTLSSTPAGGTWSSSDLTVATVGSSSGVVAGISAGSSLLTYTSAASCSRTIVVIVNPLPLAIVGTLDLCAGTTTTLTNATPGGVWTSGTTAVAPVGLTSGIVTGSTAGNAVISYTLPTNCGVSANVTVNALPAVIGGTPTVCVGSNRTLSSTPTGGTWSSSNATTATVGSSSGVVTGLLAGTTTITYTLGTGCFRTQTVTVNALPADITGTMSTCAGGTTTLSSPTPGGTWSSGAPSVAAAGATGIVSGVAAGTAAILYTLGTGCNTSAIVTINPLPAAISGPGSVCLGSSITLTSITTGGTWSSSTPATASVGSSSGVVNGVATGAATMTYTLPTGCNRTTTITVNPLPAAGTISGSNTVCVGSATALASTVSGGFWSITTGKAAISVAGLMTGMSAGADTIRYSVTTVCGTATVSYPVTVNPLPVAGSISGNNNLCLGYTTVLSGTVSGGSWSSGHPTIATVSGTGIVLGLSLGTARISYTVTNVCGSATTTTNVIVNPIADAGLITGADTVCQSDTIHIDNATPGGTWSSSNNAIATVSASGVVTGLAPGTATIRYRVTNICSADTATLLLTVKSAAACATRVTTLTGSSAGIHLFPNPTNGAITVETTGPGTLTVFTLEGKEIVSHTVIPGTSRLRLPGHLAAGIYMCRFTGNDGTTTNIRLVYQP